MVYQETVVKAVAESFSNMIIDNLKYIIYMLFKYEQKSANYEYLH